MVFIRNVKNVAQKAIINLSTPYCSTIKELLLNAYLVLKLDVPFSSYVLSKLAPRTCPDYTYYSLIVCPLQETEGHHEGTGDTQGETRTEVGKEGREVKTSATERGMGQ